MSIIFYFYLIVVGYSLASALEAAYAYCLGHQLQFVPGETQDILWEAPRFTISILAGPGILMRNCLAAVRAQKLSTLWLLLSTILAMFWSYCLGVLAVDFYLYLITPEFG